jgi:hypothetical protein
MVADSGLSSSLSKTYFNTYSISSFNFAYYYPEQLLQVDPNILSQDIYMFFEFELGSTFIEETYVRLNFFELLFGLGSILYTLRSISNGLVDKFSNFTVDHSMI